MELIFGILEKRQYMNGNFETINLYCHLLYIPLKYTESSNLILNNPIIEKLSSFHDILTLKWILYVRSWLLAARLIPSAIEYNMSLKYLNWWLSLWEIICKYVIYGVTGVCVCEYIIVWLWMIVTLRYAYCFGSKNTF